MPTKLSIAKKITATLVFSAAALAQAAEPVRIGFIDLLSGPFALTDRKSTRLNSSH